MNQAGVPDSRLHDPPIRLDRADERGRWTMRLMLFLRVTAVLMILKGLYHWSILCGVGDGTGARFEAMPAAWQVATVFFAILDIVSGVGLWLLAAWGAAVWLLAGTTQMVIDLWFPEVYGAQVPFIIAYGLLLAGYVVLRVLAYREKVED